MRIKSVNLENIKRFGQTGYPFNLHSDHKIHTVSGVNGSGKTAIFKALQLFQKLFFFDQLQNHTEESAVKTGIKKLIDQLLSSEQGLIDVIFTIDEDDHRIILKIQNTDTDFDYEFECNDAAEDAVLGVWNIENPTSLIVFLDAGKSFSDFGVSFDNISLKPRKQRNTEFLLDCIFNPEETFQAIYKRTVLDHIHYRLDPSRTYDHFRAANEAIKLIAPNIEVKNVSATKKDGHLVILGKSSPEAQLFDIKDFSAGERSLYLTLLFMFYLPNVGILVIDEPENHFHESMLSGFYRFLKEMLDSGGPQAWMSKILSSRSNSNSTQANQKGNLEQIFLITHSKPLIYQNSNFGECFILSNDELLRVYSSSLESELRNAGISSVYSRTLFVEGKGDIEILSPILALHRINTVPLADCKEVIEHFKKISTIRGSIHGASFCFAIDRDNKSISEIEEIKKIDPAFFDESFIVLDRHEVENYLIDCELIRESINPALRAWSEPTLTVDDVESLFRKSAEGLRTHSLSKYLASALRMKAKELIIDQVSNTKNLAKSPSETIRKAFLEDPEKLLQSEAIEITQRFQKEWESNWEKLIDGKAFINILLTHLSQKCLGIKQHVIKKKITERLIQEPSKFSAGHVLQEILNKIDKQGGKQGFEISGAENKISEPA